MKGIEIGKIHSTAIVSDKAKIGKNITIGAYVIVYDNVEIGSNVIIGPNSIIGEPIANYYKGGTYSNPKLVIGSEAIIRSGAIIYAGSTIEANFECGHRVTIRENTDIGFHTRIGTLSDIQGYCYIGNYVRIHSNVHVGQKSSIGNFVWIFPYAVLANDPHPPSNVLIGVTIEDFAVVAVKAVILPGVRVGRDAIVGAMALVRSDVPSEAVMCGNPAKQIAMIRDIRSKYTDEPPYPWCEHFERGMPWEGIGYNEWLKSQQKETDCLGKVKCP